MIHSDPIFPPRIHPIQSLTTVRRLYMWGYFAVIIVVLYIFFKVFNYFHGA
jgi:hypothetical protein